MTNNKMLTLQDMYGYLYIQIIVNKSCTSNNDTSFHEQDMYTSGHENCRHCL